jgi:RNA recognition motif-containing protein
MVRTKVFVGNLAFKTKDSELVTEFSTVAKVISANIITRGPRSLGYGFVELDSEEDAEKAVAAMDKKTIDGRQINVEVAKPRADEGEEGTNNNGGANNNGFQTRGGRGTRGTRGGFRGTTRGGFRGTRGGAPPQRTYIRSSDKPIQNQQQQESDDEDNIRPRRRGGFRGRARGFRTFRGGQRRTNENGEEQPDTRVESKTSLFVANLPFALDDKGFADIFTAEGLKFKSVKVITKRNGRSKGFGFAEFDSHEDQQKALNTLNGKQVQERELSLKVALTDENQTNSNTNANTNSNNQQQTKSDDKKEEEKKEGSK